MNNSCIILTDGRCRKHVAEATQQLADNFSRASRQNYISDVNKTKFLRPRPPEVNKGTWRI